MCLFGVRRPKFNTLSLLFPKTAIFRAAFDRNYKVAENRFTMGITLLHIPVTSMSCRVISPFLIFAVLVQSTLHVVVHFLVFAFYIP